MEPAQSALNPSARYLPELRNGESHSVLQQHYIRAGAATRVHEHEQVGVQAVEYLIDKNSLPGAIGGVFKSD